MRDMYPRASCNRISHQFDLTRNLNVDVLYPIRRRCSEEELEEMRKKKEAEADKAFKSRNESMNRPVIRSVSVAEKLRALLVSIKKTKEADASATAFKTLNTLCGNVGKAPQNEKFRRINLYNPAINSRCGSIPEAVSFLEICGFNKSSCDEGEFLEIDEAAVDKVRLS